MCKGRHGEVSLLPWESCHLIYLSMFLKTYFDIPHIHILASSSCLHLWLEFSPKTITPNVTKELNDFTLRWDYSPTFELVLSTYSRNHSQACASPTISWMGCAWSILLFSMSMSTEASSIVGNTKLVMEGCLWSKSPSPSVLRPRKNESRAIVLVTNTSATRRSLIAFSLLVHVGPATPQPYLLLHYLPDA